MTAVATNPVVELLGDSLLVSKTSSKATKDIMKNKRYVLLYFSAIWCPPCQAFTPILAQFYKKHASTHKFEIVYVSSDRNLKEFNDYYGAKMPWTAIPTDSVSAQIKSKLANRLSIRGIPSLIVIDTASGQFVNGKAKEQIEAAKDAPAVKKLVDEWDNAERVTLEEGARTGAGGSGGGVLGLITGALMAILKNPVYIFGLLYMYKYVMRTVKTYLEDENESTITGGEL